MGAGSLRLIRELGLVPYNAAIMHRRVIVNVSDEPLA
jgi:hypothetical protein